MEGDPNVAASNESALAEESNKSTGNSSDTMEESMATKEEEPVAAGEEEEVSPLDSLSTEERRKLKGKGKATVDEPQRDDKHDDQEVTRLNRELAFKNSLIASQAALLSNFRSTVACMVCLETLEKPYALACGHVFCRKCLLEWFFRPDPTAEDNDSSRSGSPSGSGSRSSSSSSSSSSDSDEETGSRSGSNSNASSYVGGTFRGQDFRIRGSTSGGNGAATFGALSDRIYQAFESGSRGAIGGGSGAGGAGGAREVPRITEAESESDGEKSEEEEDSRAKEANAEEMRKARLARFGGGGASAGTTEPAASTANNAVRDPPAPVASDSSPRPRPRSRSPTPPPPPPPPPPRAPLLLPKGEHRAKNLVCPQCRTSCSERAPHRIFVLSELLSLVRTAEESGMLQRSSATPAPLPHHSSEPIRTDLPGLDESDGTWAGLFPGVGGTESKKDRRRRLARVVRDRDDGVRRCGECNWEIDERSGTCEGCGRSWNMTSDGDHISSEDEDEDDGGLRFRFGRYDPIQRALARRQHALEDSERSDDSDDVGSSGVRGEEDEYESDGFLVRSGDEGEGAERGGGGRVRRHLSISSSESVDSFSSDVEERREATRRRERRQEGEVIDLESDTGDEDEDGSRSGSGSNSGSQSNSEEEDSGPSETRPQVSRTRRSDTESNSASEEEEGSPPPVPYRRRPDPESPSSPSSASEEEEEIRPARRKKRVIASDEESE
ncbi:RING finger protein [Sporobolomyces salmoneus]|uniref:RING finger protein n=1 Tax=Sporobolomyces salmoneus TaxID=183962 RepID=UPI00316BF8D2